MKTAKGKAKVEVARTVWRLVTEALEEGMGVKDGAAYVYKFADPVSLKRFTVAAIENVIKGRRRDEARDAEEESEAALLQIAARPNGQGGADHDRLADLFRLANTEFALTNGTITTWGLATISQHLERIGMCEQKAAAEKADAERHRAIVGMLERGGCKNLNELLSKKGARR